MQHTKIKMKNNVMSGSSIISLEGPIADELITADELISAALMIF